MLRETTDLSKNTKAITKVPFTERLRRNKQVQISNSCMNPLLLSDYALLLAKLLRNIFKKEKLLIFFKGNKFFSLKKIKIFASAAIRSTDKVNFSFRTY